MVEYNGHLAHTHTHRVGERVLYVWCEREKQANTIVTENCMQFSFLSRIQQNGPLNKMEILPF